MTSRRVHALGALATAAGLVLAALGPLADAVPAYLVVHGLWLVALLVLVRGRASASPAAVLLWALAMRLPLALGPEPSLSDDAWRYVWEGRVVATGGDPWDDAPTDPTLAALAASAPEHPRINHPELPAIYPPLAQGAFAGLVAARLDRVEAFRAALVACDLALIAVLLALCRARGRPAAAAALYAWNPLAVVEVASSGHYEPLALLPMVVGLLLWERRRAGAWLFWGVALGTKIVGAAPAWFAARRLQAAGRPLRAALGLAVVAAVAAAPAIPFSLDGSPPIGSLGTYVEHWGNNASVHALLTPWLGYHPARRAVAALFLLWALGLTVRAPRPLEGFALLFVGLIVLSPVVHPWYGLWLAVLLPLLPRLDLALLSGLLPLSYLGWTSQAAGGPWEAPTWAPWVEIGLPAAAWAASWRRRRGPPAPGAASPRRGP